MYIACNVYATAMSGLPCQDLTQLTAAQRRTRGYSFALLGAILVTPDAVCVRLATSIGGGTFWWTISTKCFLLFVMILSFVAWQHGWRKLPAGIAAGPAHCALVVLFQCFVTIGFPTVFQTTTTAKGLLLISLNPLWAALLGWRVLGDTLPRRTLIALFGAALSIGIIFIPPALMPEEGGGTVAIAADGVGNWRGDLIAVGTGLSLAAMITSSRYGSQRRPKALMALAAALGSLVAGLVTFTIACSVSWSEAALLRPIFWPIMVADAFCIAACTVLALTFAPRHISPAEVALVLLLEVALGPLWVFVAGFEAPSTWTLAGGGVLVAVLAAHELSALREARRVQREAKSIDISISSTGEPASTVFVRP